MKFIALLSGGKDSIYSTLQAIENGHDLVCCAHLAPVQKDKHNLEEEESYMYQTAGSEAVRMQVEECMGVPFYVREISGRSVNTALVYDDTTIGSGLDVNKEEDGVSDEVEDLYLLLQQILREHPEITAVSSGAILSTYQRTRIENVASRLNLSSLSYLWRMSCQRTLLDSILDDGGIEAVLVRVACPPGLMPRRHLGKSLRDLRDGGVLDHLREKWGMHPAGEGGEYETLVLDCPRLFKCGRLVLEETEVVCDESDDGVGVLRIVTCRVEKRENDDAHGNNKGNESETATVACQQQQQQVAEQVQKAKSNLHIDVADDEGRSISSNILNQARISMNLPNVRIMKGGLCHISALLSPISCNSHSNEADAAVHEFLSIRKMLHTILSRLFPNDEPPTSPRDVLYVHLYLSEISHFAKINEHYREFFGTTLPPSRSCVAVGRGALPGGRRVMMDCVLQRGSGAYLRSGDNGGCGSDITSFLYGALQNKNHALRKTLHVQSISHWAPVCIGPYSQANVLRSSLVFLAGMVGLVPQRMTLIEPPPHGSQLSGWEVQLYQSWKNATSVLDGLEDRGGRLDDCLGGLVYFSLGALESVAASSTASTCNGNQDGVVNDSSIWNKLWRTAGCICNDALSTNAGVVMGSVDGATDFASMDDKDPSLYDEDGVLYGGYEDEETWREMSGMAEDEAQSSSPADSKVATGIVPLLMVCLPELPASAEAEVELICASRRAASCLGISNGSSAACSMVPCNESDDSTAPLDRCILWDTGYGRTKPPLLTNDRQQGTSCIELSSAARYAGLGCACVSTVMASLKPSNNESRHVNFNFGEILGEMIDLSISNAKGVDGLGSLFTIEDVLNVRLYYKSAHVDHTHESPFVRVEMLDDGSQLRTQLHSVLQFKSRQFHDGTVDRTRGGSAIPAYTVVPVLGMHLLSRQEEEMHTNKDITPLLSMQVTLVDTIRMETEMWVRHNRQYKVDN